MSTSVTKNNGEIDPRDWGIDFDTSSGAQPLVDSTAQWQSLIAHVNSLVPSNLNEPTSSVRILCPPGLTVKEGPGLELPYGVELVAHGKGTILCQTGGSDAFLNYTSGRYNGIGNLTFWAHGGGTRCIDVDRFARSWMSDLWFYQDDPQQPMVRLNPGAPSGFFIAQMQRLWFWHVGQDNTAPCVPSFDVVADTPKFQACSAKEFTFFRWGDVGDPAMRLQVTGAGRNDGNHFDNMIFEHCRGGGIHMWGMGSSTFTNVQSYDVGDANTMTGGLLEFRAPLGAGKGSEANTIISPNRSAGQLAPSVADIYFDAASKGNTVMSIAESEVTAGNGRAPFTVDFSDTDSTLISAVPIDGVPDVEIRNAANTLITQDGTIKRFDTGGVLRSLGQPTGAGPAQWV